MRASTLTFIFIIFEYSIITGGDGNCGDPPEIENAQKPYNINSRFRMNCTAGYKREAGTSNLFKCENNTWKNSPSLKCILTGGIVVVVILGVAAAVAILLLRRRSRLRRAGGNPVDMTVLAQGSEQPLIKTTMSSCPPDSTQSPVTLFKDATETMYTDSPLSA
ncbi:hypothetical protein QTP70_021000 [Hemibagrus guttatus]|uniref:Sushi domain-containing protein n=1 Tax=Hemibagrus guttatus TaxID=175788 RepID=A0AAE0QAW6_9TELE|nr:hypothetical protein QTP70_021000 [Hemibagrus guttatus]